MASPSLLHRPSWHCRPDREATFPEIDGTSAAVQRLTREMGCVARDADISVLITGESGTGKERVARAIHRASARGNGPFVVIDCAGLSATLAEDSLFGHVRGAFTGAVEDRAGPFERASGGTVLLDEIGDLPLDLQMKLLRALQSRSVLRLGATRESGFDARIIAATNVNLDAARARGRFREDLYYRLKVFDITVPPLRQRGACDIRALVAVAVRRYSARRNRVPVPIDAEVMDVLVKHSWPGNVRELENAVERMLAASGGDAISLRHLPVDLVRVRSIPSKVAAPAPDEIAAALERHGFRVALAAAELRLSRHQLYRRMTRYGIRQRTGAR
jgi:two-component system response regulator HydG